MKNRSKIVSIDVLVLSIFNLYTHRTYLNVFLILRSHVCSAMVLNILNFSTAIILFLTAILFYDSLLELMAQTIHTDTYMTTRERLFLCSFFLFISN